MFDFSLYKLSLCFTDVKLFAIEAIYSINDFWLHVFVNTVFEAKVSWYCWMWFERKAKIDLWKRALHEIHNFFPKRQFIQRKIEHKLLDNSSVHKHMTEENHRIDWDDMQVIDTARDDRRLLLKEMLHINNLKPQLNVQKSSKLFSLLIGSRDKET